MKFIRPGNGAVPSNRSIARSRRPQWQQKWIEDQPRFVLLACGHKTDIGIAGTLIIRAGKKAEVYCERCRLLSKVKRSISLTQYADIPDANSGDVPLF